MNKSAWWHLLVREKVKRGKIADPVLFSKTVKVKNVKKWKEEGSYLASKTVSSSLSQFLLCHSYLCCRCQPKICFPVSNVRCANTLSNCVKTFLESSRACKGSKVAVFIETSKNWKDNADLYYLWPEHTPSSQCTNWLTHDRPWWSQILTFIMSWVAFLQHLKPLKNVVHHFCWKNMFWGHLLFLNVRELITLWEGRQSQFYATPPIIISYLFRFIWSILNSEAIYFRTLTLKLWPLNH